MCRVVSVFVFVALLGASISPVGCSKANPTAPSGSSPTPTITESKADIKSIFPPQLEGLTLTYGEFTISVDVSYEILASDASSTLTVYACLGIDRDTIVASACHGKGISGARSGTVTVGSITVPNSATFTKVSETHYIHVFLVRNGILNAYQENLDVQTTLYFPLSRLSPVIIGETKLFAVNVKWKSP